MLTSPVLVDTEAMRVGGVNDCTAIAASILQRLAKAIWLAEIRCELPRFPRGENARTKKIALFFFFLSVQVIR
jgi:hypothetical protein